MNAFDRLNPALQHHIVNTLGWPGLRPLQELTIAPVLDGEHAILLAPTAGGKTEAAVFPVFSRMLDENWQGLSVLYVCPIKALLNNLAPRLDGYLRLLGRSAAVWHGDVGASKRAKLVAEPPDLLLTTPESLEVMLVSRQVDHDRFLGNVRTVIIDEVHAFAGDDRGWHLLYLLERLQHLTGRPVQRLGLSATVGNPRELCDWLAKDCPGNRQVIEPPPTGPADSDVKVDYVGTLQNAALVISRLHQGEKRLVFCDSRARVEELAAGLRILGVQTHVSHSSLSADVRRQAEEAFEQGSNCVIVSTSTLELGIDVGDLDRVIQIDAAGTVASFLQRIGRTGRRAGTLRNCLFLATSKEDLLHTLAIVRLWQDDYVEPIVPPPMPLHILAQQIMALVLQQSGLGRADWRRWLGRLPGLDGLAPSDIAAVIDDMIERGILHDAEGLLGMGDAGEREFGYRNFMELFSVFTSSPLITVRHGREDIGSVDQLTFAARDKGPAVLSLGGCWWQTRYVDWGKRVAYVEPTTDKGRSQWKGMSRMLGFAQAQAIQNVLLDGVSPKLLSNRAQECLDDLRDQRDWVEADRSLLIQTDNGNVAWWTFCGGLANAAIVAALNERNLPAKADDLCITFDDTIAPEIALAAAKDIAANAQAHLVVPLDADFLGELKFGVCLGEERVEQILRARFTVSDAALRLEQLPVALIRIG